MQHRGRLGASVGSAFFIGLIGLFTLMQRPRFATYHTVDVVQLLATGMCFGVALVALIALVRGPQAD
jgi:hypothetical protein